MLGNTFVAEKQLKPPNKEVPPKVKMLSLELHTLLSVYIHCYFDMAIWFLIKYFFPAKIVALQCREGILFMCEDFTRWQHKFFNFIFNFFCVYVILYRNSIGE